MKKPLYLVATCLVLIGVYVFFAKNVFEADKMNYARNAQQSQLRAVERVVDARLSQTFLAVRTAIATYDSSEGQLSPSGQRIFQEEKNLIGFELTDETQNRLLMHLTKAPDVIPAATSSAFPTELGKIELKPESNGIFLMRLRYQRHGGDIFRLQAALDFSEILPNATPFQSLALVDHNQVVMASDAAGHGRSLFENILQQRTPTYLVTRTPLAVAGLELIGAVPKRQAIDSLQRFFYRSLIYVIAAFFTLLALMLSLFKDSPMEIESPVRASGLPESKLFQNETATLGQIEIAGTQSDGWTYYRQGQDFVIETKNKGYIRINSETGNGTYMKAGQEESGWLLCELHDKSFACSPLASCQKREKIFFHLDPNDTFILIDSRDFRDVEKMSTDLNLRAEFTQTARQLTWEILAMVDPVNTQLVCVRRRGPERRAVLESELGDFRYDSVSNRHIGLSH